MTSTVKNSHSIRSSNKNFTIGYPLKDENTTKLEALYNNLQKYQKNLIKKKKDGQIDDNPYFDLGRDKTQALNILKDFND